MSLEKAKEAISQATLLWAKEQGLPLPKNIPFTPAPSHVMAELSLPWPLQAAKAVKRDPLEVAQRLSSALASKIPGVERVEASAPGFVNFRFDNRFLSGILHRILENPASFGSRPEIAHRSVLIEFVSANPTGPLHLASGRAATLGDSLVRILRRIGHKVGAEYYVNDAGRQVELLGRSVAARYSESKGKPASFPEDGYQGQYIHDLAAAAPPEASGWDAQRFGRFAIEKMLDLHRKDMAGFGVHFDQWFLESRLHSLKSVEGCLDFLKQKKMAYEKDGATWLGTASAEGTEDDKDRVLVKSDGRPTYFLADIAYHKDKFDRGWKELIDIWGADHHGYVPRMKAAVASLGRDPQDLHIIIHQLVHLYRGKELVKMSKRAGEFVTLKELVEEVGRDACRFFFAMRGPNVHMNFDLELAKKQSQENPVYYVQYVHARIRSIFREAEKLGIPSDTKQASGPPVGDLLSDPSERALLVKLAWFPETLANCEAALSPHPLTTYLLELAGLFHPFYERCRVADIANVPLSQARLALCDGIAAVIREGLGLLGVSSPEQM